MLRTIIKIWYECFLKVLILLASFKIRVPDCLHYLWALYSARFKIRSSYFKSPVCAKTCIILSLLPIGTRSVTQDFLRPNHKLYNFVTVRNKQNAKRVSKNIHLRMSHAKCVLERSTKS